MNALNPDLYPNTRVASLLNRRPLAVTWLETRGVDPFRRPDTSLEQVCRQIGMDWESLVEEIRTLQVPKRNSDWSTLPLCHLLDYLTQEHREFSREFLPAIRNAFTAGEGKPDFLGPLLPLLKAWPDFSSALLEHIGEEESVLFPEILRYEYCVNHRIMEPDCPIGIGKALTSLRFLHEEQKLVNLIREFLDSASFSADRASMGLAAAGLFRLLDLFQDRLFEHARLERDVLLPRVAQLEKRLAGNPSGDRDLNKTHHRPMRPIAAK